jgi:hypothetical protein
MAHKNRIGHETDLDRAATNQIYAMLALSMLIFAPDFPDFPGKSVSPDREWDSPPFHAFHS